jgi:hypothetical protein
MFQLTAAEHAALISQIATSKPGRGGRRKLPWVFTEHGAIQAANVLNSPRAVEMGIYVVRAFVKLRDLLASNRELARRFEQLEARVEKLVAHDQSPITEIVGLPGIGSGSAFEPMPNDFFATLHELGVVFYAAHIRPTVFNRRPVLPGPKPPFDDPLLNHFIPASLNEIGFGFRLSGLPLGLIAVVLVGNPF